MPNRNEQDSSKSRSQLARVLARWEAEGGTTSSMREEEDEERAVLAKEEEHILECLGDPRSDATNFAGQGRMQPMRFATEQAALLVQGS